MVKLTKEKALQYLLILKRKNQMGSSKYTAIGALRIFIKKNIISVEDIVEEFPELDTDMFSTQVDKQTKIQDIERERGYASSRKEPIG